MVRSGPVHGDRCIYELYDRATGAALDGADCRASPLPDWAAALRDDDEASEAE